MLRSAGTNFDRLRVVNQRRAHFVGRGTDINWGFYISSRPIAETLWNADKRIVWTIVFYLLYRLQQFSKHAEVYYDVTYPPRTSSPKQLGSIENNSTAFAYLKRIRLNKCRPYSPQKKIAHDPTFSMWITQGTRCLWHFRIIKKEWHDNCFTIDLTFMKWLHNAVLQMTWHQVLLRRKIVTCRNQTSNCPWLRELLLSCAQGQWSIET